MAYVNQDEMTLLVSPQWLSGALQYGGLLASSGSMKLEYVLDGESGFVDHILGERGYTTPLPNADFGVKKYVAYSAVMTLLSMAGKEPSPALKQERDFWLNALMGRKAIIPTNDQSTKTGTGGIASGSLAPRYFDRTSMKGFF